MDILAQELVKLLGWFLKEREHRMDNIIKVVWKEMGISLRKNWGGIWITKKFRVLCPHAGVGFGLLSVWYQFCKRRNGLIQGC